LVAHEKTTVVFVEHSVAIHLARVCLVNRVSWMLHQGLHHIVGGQLADSKLLAAHDRVLKLLREGP